jgi:hypothetical protein
MTDALGEWALRYLDSMNSLARLSALDSEESLCNLVLAERAAKRMRVDDSTLIVFSFGESNSNGLPII